MTITLPDDVLIPDKALAEKWNTTTKTLRRYDNQPDGLPYWILANKKFRGVKTSSEWLARRMKTSEAA